MTKQAKTFELTIVYEQSEGDHVTAQIPSVPGAISFGANREEARRNVLDALAELLSVEPATASSGATERLGLTFSVEQNLGRELGLER